MTDDVDIVVAYVATDRQASVCVTINTVGSTFCARLFLPDMMPDKGVGRLWGASVTSRLYHRTAGL